MINMSKSIDDEQNKYLLFPFLLQTIHELCHFSPSKVITINQYYCILFWSKNNIRKVSNS